MPRLLSGPVSPPQRIHPLQQQALLGPDASSSPRRRKPRIGCFEKQVSRVARSFTDTALSTDSGGGGCVCNHENTVVARLRLIPLNLRLDLLIVRRNPEESATSRCAEESKRNGSEIRSSRATGRNRQPHESLLL